MLKATFLSGSQAKKRQIYLEETYGGSMRELEMLVNTFSVESEAGTKKGKSQSSNFFDLQFSPYCLILPMSISIEPTFSRKGVDSFAVSELQIIYL